MSLLCSEQDLFRTCCIYISKQVNFLAHYHFDHRKDDPHFNVGLLFPDLLRNFIPGARFHDLGASALGSEAKSLYDGCLQHIASDKIFHNWSGFTEGMSVAGDSFKESAEPFERLFFLNHIFVELVIDKMLVNEHPDLPELLYADFDQADRGVFDEIMQALEIPEPERFHAGYERFMEVQYLRKYKEYSNIAYALGRICTKMGLKPFTEYQKSYLHTVAERIEEFESTRLDQLHEALQQNRI